MKARQLPDIDKLRWLVKLVGPFPASARRILFYAKHFGLNEDIIVFLQLFHTEEIFQGRSDFITRCEELKMMINEELKMPIEVLRSPV